MSLVHLGLALRLFNKIVFVVFNFNEFADGDRNIVVFDVRLHHEAAYLSLSVSDLLIDRIVELIDFTLVHFQLLNLFLLAILPSAILHVALLIVQKVMILQYRRIQHVGVLLVVWNVFLICLLVEFIADVLQRQLIAVGRLAVHERSRYAKTRVAGLRNPLNYSVLLVKQNVVVLLLIFEITFV